MFWRVDIIVNQGRRFFRRMEKLADTFIQCLATHMAQMDDNKKILGSRKWNLVLASCCTATIHWSECSIGPHLCHGKNSTAHITFDPLWQTGSNLEGREVLMASIEWTIDPSFDGWIVVHKFVWIGFKINDQKF